MHKSLILSLALIVTMQCAGAAPAEKWLDEDDWSWRDGLLGRDTPDGDIFADDGDIFPGYMCDTCRDPYEHPMDFVAVAYNGYFGENRWLRDSQLGIPFRIYNLDMQWVVVWFEGIVFDSITFLPDTMDVRVRLQNGEIRTFSVIQGGPDLTVGDPNPTPPAGSNNCSCGDDGDDGEGDDDYSDIDDYAAEEPEDSEPSGVVEILDPDEEGGFPEWDL